MNAYDCVNNFSNSFNQIGLLNLTNSLKTSFVIYKRCCEKEDFEFGKLSQQFQKLAMLHDLMAMHYGYWGYLEHAEVQEKLRKKLFELCKKTKKEIVDFYVYAYMQSLKLSAEIELMEAQGVHVIDCAEME